MKKHTLELTTEQLMFIAGDLIRGQLKHQYLIEEYCHAICDTKSEANSQKKWHLQMLRELEQVDGIKRYWAALEKACQAIL